MAVPRSVLLLLFLVAGCTSSGATPDTSPPDVADATHPGEIADVAVALPTCAAPAVIPDPATLGFPLQAPSEHHVDCQGNPEGFEPMSTDAFDVNWVCTFEHAGTFGVLYLPAVPVDCHWDLMTAVDYATPAATLLACGEAIALVDPHYDWGGNHHNDFLQFEVGGRRYKVFHSSFDYKWRTCHAPDCLQVYDLDGTLHENGCTAERSLPVVCVRVADDGTVPPLVDTFEPCE